MRRRPPSATMTNILFPYPTLFRSRSPSSILDSLRPLVDDCCEDFVGLFSRKEEPRLVLDHLAERAASLEPFAILRLEIPDLKARSGEHTSELQSLMRISYAVFCLKKKQYNNT